MKRLAFLLLSAMLVAPAQAAPKSKTTPQQAQKKPLVLMPLRLAESEQGLQGAMETALIEGLAKKYKVYSGEQVAKKAREIFAKESRNTAKKECDETRCLQGIAESFQSELLAIANVTKQDGGYFLALSIRNIFDNQDEYSKSLPCKGCDAFQVVEKLKELIDTPASVAAAPVAEPPPPKITATDPDSITWAEAQKGNTADDYQVYLDAYPKGKYVAFAKAKLKKLKEAEQAAAEQQEQQLWDSVQQENSEAGYNRYLTAYSNGRFAGFAKTRMIKLREEDTKGPAMVAIPDKNYEIGKYDVTQKEWRDIMGSNPSRVTIEGDNRPVEQVSWEDVQIFLQKLNAKTGKQYRLPTEAEWEYACYGGSQTKYCGGNNLDSVAWYRDNSHQVTGPVGEKQANSFGLYDMSGNVWQWMENLYDNNEPAHGRVLRGGSWLDGPEVLHASNRIAVGSPIRQPHFGFRLARTLP